ncbi:MAG: transglycosylase domain-containing protein [Anaerolineales bacterium]|jgi:penicillin-binding protein 1C
MSIPPEDPREDSQKPQEDPRERLRRLLASEDETMPELPIPDEEPGGSPSDETIASVFSSLNEEEEESPEPPEPEATPDTPLPALDKDNMPLPRRVDEIDVGATRVSPAAYTGPQRGSARSTPPSQPTGTSRAATGVPSQPPVSRPASQPVPTTPPVPFWKGRGGCLLRGFIVILFIMVGLALLGGSIALYQYYAIARTLPSVSDLRERASQFETTRILDRNGNLLYEIIDPNAGRRTYVPLERISPNVVAATIATEDKDFYSHPGFDPVAIIRALWENYRTEGQGGGASTITQQLARNLLLSPEERVQRTYTRKAREIILAAEITRRYSKDEILELYLNENYYGNLAYGIEAAAETYFNKTADQLDLAEGAFLAGLPQSPSIYDIYTNPEETLMRHQQVLVLMFQLSSDRGCIPVSNSDDPVCVTPPDATSAANEIKSYPFRPPNIQIHYPHWVNFVRSQLEELYDPQTIYRSGFTIYTTLDPNLQDTGQRIVTEQVAALIANNAHNGALVSIKPSTGEILAMVGSADFYNDAIDGQVNMATSPTRQPGSSIKPINYVAAFEKGWTPATLIWDVPSEFPPSGNPNDPREPYKPVNYDNRFHGPVTVRTALSNSFNVPAVKTLDFVGIYDDPETSEKEGMIGMAERLGITSLTRNDYGLSLTLGGGDVSLIEMTGAFSVFANGGRRVPPVAILKIVDHTGEVVYEYEPESGEQVIRPEHAYLINSILSDNEARSWMFGRNSALNLSFPVAAKTGTTNDFRDNWTLGFTPDLATGVWVGNADYTPMINTSGLSGAAPIWSQYMEIAVPYASGGSPTPFTRPPGIVDKIICATSGTEPSNWCRDQRSEIFAADQPPLPSGKDLFRKTTIDTWTGLEASNACNEFTEEVNAVNTGGDPWAEKWIQTGAGKDWLESHGFPRNVEIAPQRECENDDPQPTIEFRGLKDGDVITDNDVEIRAVIDAPDGIKSWKLEYGSGNNPNSWEQIANGDDAVESPTTLLNWDVSDVDNGTITLRLTVTGDKGYAEHEITLKIDLPVPTPTPTLTPSATLPVPTDTPTPTPTNTLPMQTNTPTPTPTPSVTSFPSETPTTLAP